MQIRVRRRGCTGGCCFLDAGAWASSPAAPLRLAADMLSADSSAGATLRASRPACSPCWKHAPSTGATTSPWARQVGCASATLCRYRQSGHVARADRRFSCAAERGERLPACELDLGTFRHLLVVFGGPQGLEYALQHDDLSSTHSCPSELFGKYLNTCFDQGSRTIRSEEAILISLAFLQPAIGGAAR